MRLVAIGRGMISLEGSRYAMGGLSTYASRLLFSPAKPIGSSLRNAGVEGGSSAPKSNAHCEFGRKIDIVPEASPGDEVEHGQGRVSSHWIAGVGLNTVVMRCSRPSTSRVSCSTCSRSRAVV